MANVLVKILPLSLLFAQWVNGATVYSETISGDLNDSISGPSHIGSLGLGENTVIGTINEGGQSEDGDVFTFVIDPNLVLTSLSFTVDSVGESHFLALHDESLPEFDPEDLLFATLVSSSQNSTNILPSESDGGSFSGAGFDLPLTAGEYSLWFQETSTNEVNYTFRLTTQAVPEPSTMFLLLLSSACFMQRRFRKND